MAITINNRWESNNTGVSATVPVLDGMRGDMAVIGILSKDGTGEPTPPTGWTKEAASPAANNCNVSVFSRDTGQASNYITDQLFQFPLNGWQPEGGFFIGGASREFLYYKDTQDDLNQYRLSVANDFQAPAVPVSEMDLAPAGNVAIAMDSTGTTMLLLIGLTELIQEYTLSTAWDITTASATANSYDISTVVTGADATGIVFKPDGLKFYISCTSGGVYEYSLSTAWDITSTVTHLNTYATGKTGDAYNIAFNADGTRMFYPDVTANRLLEYTVATGWSMASVSLTTTHAQFVSKTYAFERVLFNNDGTELIIRSICVSGDYEHAVYTLGTAYDVTDETYSNMWTPYTSFSLPIAAIFNADGTKIFAISPEAIGTFPLEDAYDLSGLYAAESGVAFPDPGNGTWPSYTTAYAKGAFIKSDGTKFWMIVHDDMLWQYSMSTAYDASTASYQGQRALTALWDITKVSFNNTGTRCYLHGGTAYAGLVAAHTCSAWNPCTGSFGYQGIIQNTYPIANSIRFSTDQLTVQFMATNGKVYEYTINQAGDLYSATETLVSQVATPDGALHFSTTYDAAVEDDFLMASYSGFRKMIKVDFEMPDITPTFSHSAEDTAMVVYELAGVDQSTAYVSAVLDNGKVTTPGTVANAALVDFILGGFGADQVQVNALDSLLTQDTDILTAGGASACSLTSGYVVRDQQSIPAMTHSMDSSDECAGFYIGLTATLVHDATFDAVSPNSVFAGGGEIQSSGHTAAFAVVSPNSNFAGAAYQMGITEGAFDTVSPNSYFSSKPILSVVNIESFAVQLAYNVAGIAFSKDFRHFQLVAHLAPDVELPLKRFTLRRISSGSAEGLTGTTTLDAYVPKGYDDILNQLKGADVTLSVLASYQGAEVYAPLGTATIQTVRFTTDKDYISGSAPANWPLRPESLITVPRSEVIYSAPNQIRTTLRDDILPGMFVRHRSVDQEITQVTMYAEYNSGLTEILTR